MTLARIINKKNLVVVGMNSGTSADGVDLAALRITTGGKRPGVAFLARAGRRYTPELKQRVLRAARAESIAPEEIMQLDQALGRFFGQAAGAFLRRLKREGMNVDVVASHGQTIRHRPIHSGESAEPFNTTMQLGCLEQIASLTGTLVVGDFRQADIALGNEGAPITVAAVERLLGDEERSRLIVNIGGISNYYYLPARKVRRPMAAADCGPGNSLCDLLTDRLYHEPYDRNGSYARRGVVSQRLLSMLLAHPFLRNRSTSTGREEFGFRMADDIETFGRQFSLDGADLLATAAEFTTTAIVQAVLPLLGKDRSVTKLYLTGGGERNKFYRERLASHLPGVSIASVRELGIDPQALEAAAYAVMGAATIRSQPSRTVFTGGKRQVVQPVAGKIAQPPRKARV